MEADGLDRDQRLVVIHADDGIEAVAGVGLKGGVGGERPRDIEARCLERLDGGTDDRHLLLADLAAFAGMRVKAGDGEPRPGDAEALRQRRGQHPRLALDRRLRQPPRHFLQRDVDGHRHAAQRTDRQHHHRLGMLARLHRQSGEIVGMALMAETGGVERLLLDRIGDDAGDLAGKSQLHRPIDRADHRGCLAGIGTAGRRCRLSHGAGENR